MRIKRIIDEVSEAIFPSNIYCISCGSLIDRTRPYSLCDRCIRKMHWINDLRVCSKCGKALQETFMGDRCYDCMLRSHYFTKGFSCLTYGLHEREIMMDIKYNSKGYLAVKMGDILYDRMRHELGSLDIGLIVPVPVSRERLKKRGYNQTALMARQMRSRWVMDAPEENVPETSEHILYRTRATIMLRSLNPAQRSLALEGAFAVKSGTEDGIQGRNILLIDDIYTTGATCDSCSKALLEAGASKVYVLTLCSGGNRRPSDVDVR
ncbi:MAG: ComF family protein [Firmicutes bacterium]|nr:ComF family protein [Bacillota bacterium]